MKISTNNKTVSIIMVLLSGILWGTISIYTTNLTKSGLDSVTIIVVRSLLTAIMLGVFLLFYNPKLFKIKLKSLPSFFGMGVISFSLFNICYFKSMQLNSIGTACILLYTAPIFVMIFSALIFKEKLTPIKLLCLVLAILGCFLVSGVGGKASALGIILGLGSGLGYALYSIFGTFALKENHFFTSIFYAFLLSALCLTPLCDWKQIVYAVSNDTTTVFLLFGISFFNTVLPYILYTSGLKKVPAGEASVIACVEPIVANLLGIFIFKQIPTFTAVLGIILILLAVVILSLQNKE